MMNNEPLYIRRRLRELKSKVRSANDPLNDQDLDDDVRNLFRDIINNLASQRDHDIHVVRDHLIDALKTDLVGPSIRDRKIKANWIWPIINVGTTYGRTKIEGVFEPYSALKMYGYTVGKTNGWPVQKRQTFLSDFVEWELPDEVEDRFPGEYGMPMTAQRLRKIANVIASNGTNFHRKDAKLDAKRYAAAISDWKEDLEFLRITYYEGKGLKFDHWPEIV